MQRIQVGPLSSLPSLWFCSREGLQEFSRRYQRGESPEVEWDLSELWPGKMSIAAVTAFLSIAHRLRRFATRQPTARMAWNPNTLGFLYDIGFFDRAKNLFQVIPPGIVGGFSRGRTNPHTQILEFSSVGEVPFDGTDAVQAEWKTAMRRHLSGQLEVLCAPIFEPRRDTSLIIRPASGAATTVALVCAELVVNALLHSMSVPFVGIQRTSRAITVAVCDSGRGFAASLHQKKVSTLPHIESDTSAILIASLLNKNEYGLFRAIEGIVSLDGGRVVVSSRDGEIEWNRQSWLSISHIVKASSSTFERFEAIRAVLGQTVPRSAGGGDFDTGSWRTYRHGMPGSRVVFEVWFGDHDRSTSK